MALIVKIYGMKTAEMCGFLSKKHTKHTFFVKNDKKIWSIQIKAVLLQPIS